MTPSSSSDAEGRTWLVHASATRTLVGRQVPGGPALLVKIYETGSPAEAERELALGRRLAGPGTVPHLDAGTDPESGRPCLIQRLADGEDLERLVARSGPLPAVDAARIARGAAAVLARFHAHRDADAPHGVVHGDVKPSNVLVDASGTEPRVVLLDLESAQPAAAAPGTASDAFTGGTHGFAPPEAYRGVAPTPAADVFGLAATMHFALTGTVPFGDRGASVAAIEAATRDGRRRRWLVDGCPDRLVALLDACLAAERERRPSAADVERQLAAWLDTVDGAAASQDAGRLLALRGRPRDALDALPDDAWNPTWRARLARRARLLERAPAPTAPPADAAVESLALELEGRLAALDAFLLRFPAHDGARDARRAAVRAASRLPAELPEIVATLKRQAEFGDALALCDAALAVVRRAGRLPRPASARDRRPTPAERDPTRVLQLQRRDVANARAAHERVAARVRAAEADADPVAVEAAIGDFATLYGGASTVVAAAKDRLHRLEFYLARIGQQASVVDELARLLAELGVSVDLRALDAFRRRDETRLPGLPRGLLRALRDLVDAFPSLEARAAPAREALDAALHAVSLQATALVTEADRMLSTPPIPIRPLTSVIARLDRIVQLDALVDLPGVPRTELLDRIEAVRTRVEQARAERDRITRGAQEAMDRGHLTTAIYDMARAVDRFGGDASADTGLAEQFEEAKRRKREIEDALERNHVLAARYGDMLTDPAASSASRVATLQEREHVLSFLCTNLGPERAEPYGEDLRAVQLDLLREHAAEGERRLLAAKDPGQRLAVAQRTFDALQHESPDAGWSPAEIREARALTHRWIEVLEDATRDATDRGVGRRAARRPRRRRWLAIGITVGVALAAGGALLIGPRLWPATDDLATRLRRALGEPAPIARADDGRLEFDGGLAIGRLREFADELRGAGLADAAVASSRSIDVVDAVDRGAADFATLIAAVAGIPAATAAMTGPQDLAMLDVFARRVLRTGLALAARRGPDPALARLLDEDARLRRALSLEDADLLRRALSND